MRMRNDIYDDRMMLPTDRFGRGPELGAPTRRDRVMLVCAFIGLVLFWVIVLGGVFWAARASADSDLGLLCRKSGQASGTPAGSCPGEEVYDRPQPDDLIRSCAPGEQGGADHFPVSCWWGPNYAHRTVTSLQASQFVEVCATDMPRGTKIPHPWTAAADACKSWKVIPRSQLILATAPRIPLQWQQDMKNADGTALTDLAGFRIVYGTAANALTQLVEVRDPNARSYVLTEGLSYSTGYYLALKSFTTAGIESDKSNTVQHTTPAKPSEPAPPTKPVPAVLSVVQQQAYRIDATSNDKYTATVIGTVPVGTTCLRGFQPIMDYFLVPRAAVKLNPGVTRPRQIAAKCG
jgi:hypothetical protein